MQRVSSGGVLRKDSSVGAILAMFDFTLNWTSNLKAVADLPVQQLKIDSGQQILAVWN